MGEIERWIFRIDLLANRLHCYLLQIGFIQNFLDITFYFVVLKPKRNDSIHHSKQTIERAKKILRTVGSAVLAFLDNGSSSDSSSFSSASGSSSSSSSEVASCLFDFAFVAAARAGRPRDLAGDALFDLLLADLLFLAATFRFPLSCSGKKKIFFFYFLQFGVEVGLTSLSALSASDSSSSSSDSDSFFRALPVGRPRRRPADDAAAAARFFFGGA